MGDKPDPGESVDHVTLQVSDMDYKGPAYPWLPDPGNGFYSLPLTVYGYYEAVTADWRWIIRLSEGHVVLEGTFMDSGHWTYYCYEEYDFDPVDEVTWDFEGNSLYFTGATVTVGVFELNNPPPASWDAGPLFGFPMVDGCFAEEFPSVIEGRYLRMVQNRTKSNCKVWLE